MLLKSKEGSLSGLGRSPQGLKGAGILLWIDLVAGSGAAEWMTWQARIPREWNNKKRPSSQFVGPLLDGSFHNDQSWSLPWFSHPARSPSADGFTMNNRSVEARRKGSATFTQVNEWRDRTPAWAARQDLTQHKPRWYSSRYGTVRHFRGMVSSCIPSRRSKGCTVNLPSLLASRTEHEGRSSGF